MRKSPSSRRHLRPEQHTRSSVQRESKRAHFSVGASETGIGRGTALVGTGTGTGLGMGLGTGTGLGMGLGTGTGLGMGLGTGTGLGMGLGTGTGAGSTIRYNSYCAIIRSFCPCVNLVLQFTSLE